MQIVIDISKDRYDEIMSMDWKNCRLLFDEEIRAIHDGKALEQEPCEDCVSRQAALEAFGLSEKSRKYGGDHSGYDTLMKYEIQDILEDLPSVTAQPCEDAISRQELLKAISTWDKFGCDADTKLVPYKDHYVPYIHYDDVINCIKGMPSVTPQQKMEPCEDMVSRDAMWDVLQRLYGTEGELVEELMSLPPVLPMPKIGKWIGVNPMVDTLMCSECGENIISQEFKSNYCPNCGSYNGGEE